MIEAASDPLRREAVQEAWGTFLDTHWTWSHWVTLTHDTRRMVKGSPTHDGVGWARSAADFDRWWSDVTDEAREVARMYDRPIPDPFYLRARERNPDRYGTHFHALVGGLPPEINRRRLWSWWWGNHGSARIETFQPDKGAAFYLTKYVTKRLGETEIVWSPNAVDHRKECNDDRAGCCHGPASGAGAHG